MGIGIGTANCLSPPGPALPGLAACLSQQIASAGVFTGSPLRLPQDAMTGRVHIYFDPATKCLRFCAPNGDDTFNGFQLPLDKGCLPCKRPLLVLAQAEGLLDMIPGTSIGLILSNSKKRAYATVAARLNTLDFETGIASGYHAVWHRLKRPPGSVLLGIRLGDGTYQRIAMVNPPPGVNRLRLMPYIDGAQQLRVWDLDHRRDVEQLRGIFSFDGVTVRDRYATLFAYAKSLGYWKSL